MEKKPEFQIDAVELVRRIRDAYHEQLEGKSWEEKAAFFRERAGRLVASFREREGSTAR